ncbi:MAG: dienelactone hydrolase family protein [Gemmatimonadales bacterium]
MRRGALSVSMLAVIGMMAGALAMWTLARSPISTGAGLHVGPTTHGEWIRIANAAGDSLRAYVAYPERKDKAPAVIVIHEIFGLSEWEPTVADRLAGAGYVAIVPDLLSSRFGATPADPDSGRKLTALLTPEGVTADLDAAYGYLNRLPAVQRDDIGTIGFCWGGGKSFGYATSNPKLKAAVVCYGTAPDSTLLPGIKAKVLGVYGENDARITASLPDVERQARAAGVGFRYEIYPGTGHGFLKPGRKGSDGPEVERAWGNILAFYQDALR